ncbi:MAG TPA: glycosyltransferase, partial [Stellaceae bacterium]|nr:glycosyltransferase [Stellaceae bacterium]
MSGAVVIAAGGTGGHLFPAEALAGELIGRGERVDLVTDARSEAFAERLPGVAVHRVRAGRLQGGPLNAARGLSELAFGTFAARRLVRRLAPRVVVGFGGYPSLPTMLAAASLGLPLLIHEQNAVLGRA